MKAKPLISKLLTPLFVSFMFLTSQPPDSFAGEVRNWTGNINLLGGFKFLDEDQWPVANELDEFGIELNFRKRNWPVNIVLKYLRADTLENEFDQNLFALKEVRSETGEYNLGLSFIWEYFSHLRPFIGGGLSYVTADFRFSVPALPSLSFADSGDGLGYWVSGGVYWTLAEHLNLGMEAKYSSADVTIGGTGIDAGGFHFLFLIGYHW